MWETGSCQRYIEYDATPAKRSGGQANQRNDPAEATTPATAGVTRKGNTSHKPPPANDTASGIASSREMHIAPTKRESRSSTMATTHPATIAEPAVSSATYPYSRDNVV